MQKTLIYVTNRIHLIMAIYLVSIGVAAGLFSYFEDRSYADGLWWSFVTALTIGYGDLSPVTLYGRLVGVMFGHFWIFGVIPMIIGNVVTKLLEDRDAFTHQEQEWQERRLKEICAKLGIPIDEAPPDF